MTEPAKTTHVRWQMVAVLFLIYVLMFIDRVNISIAAKFMMPEYGLGEVEFGWVFSAFVFGYALAQIPGGWLGDRFGPRRVMTWAIIWWSSFTAFTAIAGEWFLSSLVGVVGSLAITRALIGLGEAAAPPVGARIVANWIPQKERALALGLAISGSPLGAALTPPLIVWIMVTWGWREAFYFASAAGFVVAALWYWFATDRPDQHRRVGAAELRLITQDQPEPSKQAKRPAKVPWRRLFRSRGLWLLFAAYFCFGYVVYFYFAWFYLYIVDERGFSITRGGLFTMAPFLAAAVAAPLGGLLSDRLCTRFGPRKGRCVLGFFSMSVTAVLLVFGATAKEPVVAVVLLSLSIGSMYLCLSSFWAVAIELAHDYAGTATGFLNMGANLGGTISPTLTPYLAKLYDWETAIIAMGAFCLLGSLCWLGVDPEKPIDSSTAEDQLFRE